MHATQHATSSNLLWLVSNRVQSFMQRMHSLDCPSGCPVWCLHFGFHFPRWNNCFCLTNPRAKELNPSPRSKVMCKSGGKGGGSAETKQSPERAKGSVRSKLLLKTCFFIIFRIHQPLHPSIFISNPSYKRQHQRFSVSHQHTHKDLSLPKSKRMKRDPTRLHHSQLHPPPPLSQPSDCLQT